MKGYVFHRLLYSVGLHGIRKGKRSDRVVSVYEVSHIRFSAAVRECVFVLAF